MTLYVEQMMNSQMLNGGYVESQCAVSPCLLTILFLSSCCQKEKKNTISAFYFYTTTWIPKKNPSLGCSHEVDI
jgi:hypothetical protein